MRDFEDKVAVVTGTANAKGIGAAIARRLAEAGCRVVLADLDRSGAEDRAAELEAQGATAVGLGVDMADHASVVALADATRQRFGGCHILVLNHVAPTGGPGHGLLNPDPGSWVLHANVNFLGCVYGIKAFVPAMIESGEHGHVLATVSGAGASGTMYGNGPYATTKAAITSLMECLYGQLRDAGADIAAGLVFPPVTDTFAADGLGELTVQMLTSTGTPSALNQPDDVAVFTMEALRRDAFFAHPDAADDQRLTGGRNQASIEWENGVYRRRAEALIARSDPSSYIWGPPSNLLGP